MSTSEPLISIIVPVYNAEKYLPYCIESILGQSYRNLEVILVDDGAKDYSPQICDSYAAKDSRIKVIHQENGGIGKAQNAGLDAAHGDYIAFADNDDILDHCNIELLLHALLDSGADMSKARWRQFGISQINQIAELAQQSVYRPEKVSIIKNPLHAYQTVFCKTLRLIGNILGQNTEAKYFNEANWCRLYKKELWNGIRFPEGVYAQDVMVAGKLYSRMSKVADVNHILYFWLQSPESVTHNERSFKFFHDNVIAGVSNFNFAIDNGILPKRSFYTMTTLLKQENESPDLASNFTLQKKDTTQVKSALQRLTKMQKIQCQILTAIRFCEKKIYDIKIKNKKG